MSSSNTLLKGKKVLIIGGSSGIGHGVAAASLANGASVVISSSNQARVDAAVERLKKGIEGNSEVTVTGHAFDIKDFPALTSFLSKEAPFDHLVITAGEGRLFSGGALTADTDVRELLKDSMDTRYWAVMNAANYIHKNGLVNPGGSLTMTIGAGQARPFPGWGFLMGAAGAVETATRGLAIDLKPIRVNTISPGLIDTEMTRATPPEIYKAFMEGFVPKLLVPRLGTPEEIAEAYIFAMKCQYLTGQVITVEGGAVLV